MVTLLKRTRREPDRIASSTRERPVTIMFTDIEDSTPVVDRLGDHAYADFLRLHRRIVREQVRAHRAVEVNTWGDAFMLVFPSPCSGLRCAVAIQRAFAAYNAEHAENPIRVRIGLHVGRVVRDVDDFYGWHVVLASRIACQAAGGQVLVSSAVRKLARGRDFSFDAGRDLELKGLSGRHQVFALGW